jgi:glycogen debranching enzyme
VEPEIRVGRDRQSLKLESIRCQTVLSKCLGPLSTWEDKLRVAKETGYNLIHFTPVQELAGSRSAYSLKDQLKVDPNFGNVSYEDVGKVVRKLRDEWGMASICDIVLNHTGNESEWLLDHPEATYSCYTSPHLRPAFMLDILLAKVGEDIKKGLLNMVGVPSVIDNENHIQALRHQIFSEYLPKINLHEFYQVDIENFFGLFVDAVSTIKTRDAFETQTSFSHR